MEELLVNVLPAIVTELASVALIAPPSRLLAWLPVNVVLLMSSSVFPRNRLMAPPASVLILFVKLLPDIERLIIVEVDELVRIAAPNLAVLFENVLSTILTVS